ncbi:MAG: class I SAM-dependent methyltransferase [Pseudomonadales bacterium]|nr:class I SAM-dependent methyltransferase [Pseudomonadales bacterium]
MRFIKRFFEKRKELQQLANTSAEEVFTYIYRSNKWHDPESRSGRGSNMARTATVRRELPALLHRLGIDSMLDIPCGDFYWMKEVELPVTRYIGADIVADMIAANNQLYANDQRHFSKLNLLTDELPEVDLIFCRECLVHFSFADIAQAMDTIQRCGATYLLTTHFPEVRRNTDIVTGKHRSLNLQLPPLNWPQPLEEIIEYDTGRKAGHKYLSLWRVADLPQDFL